MKILVLNCGSSSIKFQVVDMENENVLIKGTYERIGHEDAFCTYKSGDIKEKIVKPTLNHSEGIKAILEEIVSDKYGVLKSISEIEAVGHRVVHGGEKFTESILINDEVIKGIEDNKKLAPLHNGANLDGISAITENLPGVPQVAVFDTAFHQTMDKVQYIYNIPYEYYEKDRIRKYGFHGTSHRYITDRVYEIKGLKKGDDLKLITCHLGQGASIAAIENGKSIDTTMGFTPLAGLPMGTRSGDIDPSVVTYIGKKYNMTYEELDTMLNKKSGVLGVSGVHSDFRDVEEAAENGNERAKLALESNAYNTARFILGYIGLLGGVDVIAFAGGLGENGPETREKVMKYLDCFGIKLDKDKNNVRGKETIISSDDSKAEVWIIPTNEEIMIARDTLNLVKNK